MSNLIVGYMFFGGAGAGGLLVLSILGFFEPATATRTAPRTSHLFTHVVLSRENKIFFIKSYAICLTLLMVGAFCLFLDLGNPEKSLLLFSSPTFSLISIGALSIGVSALSGVVLLDMHCTVRPVSLPLLRTVLAICAVANAVVITYIGLFLGMSKSVPFWSYWFIPILFILSATSCGICVLLLIGSVRKSTLASKRSNHLLATDCALLAVECIIALVAAIQVNGTPSMVHAEVWQFWPVFIAAGLLIPLILNLVLLANPRGHQLTEIASPLLVLSGGVMLRVIIAAAGASVALVAMLA